MDIVCVSHLRWNFVFQRPQHLLTRAARDGRILYIEEPIEIDGNPRIDIDEDPSGVYVGVPRIPRSHDLRADRVRLADLVSEAIAQLALTDYVLWYYTPMALPFTHHLNAAAVVYDCMDELSAFAGAPAELTVLEDDLFRRAHLVFTGGQRLYEAKRERHPSVHAFPSSVDINHFSRARRTRTQPADQAPIRGVRLGFFGVIDERMDYDLLRDVAALRPEWQIILLGPTAKIDPETLPRAANIHYLGPKPYAVLPEYLAGWDVALLPFARNDATRFISPTKTPEYLAAGKPVVSTSIHDVVRPYGQQGLARIADSPADFVAAVEEALGEDAAERTRAADAFLSHMSWDGTWTQMRQLIQQAVDNRDTASATRAVMRRRFAIGGN
jgi:glycosyltransferase involved in cell wall biosynthesis